MPSSIFHKATGVQLLQKWPLALLLLLACVFMGALMGKAGMQLGIVIAIMPVAALFAAWVLVKPQVGLWFALIFSFLAAGFTRYIDLPWALTIDVVLFIALLGWLFKRFQTNDWKVVRYDALLCVALWFGYVVLEALNPESPGLVAWFYAMRGLGFYTLLGFVLTFSYLRKPKHVDQFFKVVLGLSVLGALWGFRQQFLGIDAAEYHWLWVGGHHDEHVLHGVLRVFSFYSDAGQFGASQAMMALVCGILLTGPFSFKYKFWIGLALVCTLLGFLYSGSRGALAVPAAGVLVYMVLSKNFKVLIGGIMGIVLVFGMLKYTYVLQQYQPVARLRTALSSDNPSLQARLKNQKTLGNYLASRPAGGGVGSAGYWGERFQPNSLLAQTPTDSYYVRLWAETGVIGLAFHLFVLGFFFGRGGLIVWRLKDPKLRIQMMAIMAAFGGVLLANYGNQVFLQFPTGFIMAIALPLVFMAPEFDQQLSNKTVKKHNLIIEQK